MDYLLGARAERDGVSPKRRISSCVSASLQIYYNTFVIEEDGNVAERVFSTCQPGGGKFDFMYQHDR